MATQLDKIKRDLIVDTVMTRTGCSDRAARAELVRMNWDAADAIRSLQELAAAKRVKAGGAEIQRAAAANHAPAKAEAVANADAHTSNVGLPTYSELVRALRRLSHPAADHTDLDNALPLLAGVYDPLDANAVDPIGR